MENRVTLIGAVWVEPGRRAAFEAYRTGPQTRALAEERASVIHRTVVWTGADAEPFTPDASE